MFRADVVLEKSGDAVIVHLVNTTTKHGFLLPVDQAGPIGLALLLLP